MNSLLHLGKSRKEVSPWIPITVLVAILALIVALLPTSLTSARAEESDGAEISVQVDEPDSSLNEPDTSLDDTSLDEVEAPILDEQPAPEEDQGTESLVDQVIGLFNQPIISPAAFRGDVITEVLTATGPTGDDIYVGDPVVIAGTWDASGLNPGLQAGDSFNIPIPADTNLSVIDQDFNLIDENNDSWGTCVADITSNAYNCDITFVPVGDVSGPGTWQGTARAEREGGRFDILPAVSDLTLQKGGSLVVDGPALGGQLPGTVTRWDVSITSDNFSAITNDVVLNDTITDTLTVCDNASITNLVAYQNGLPLNVTMSNVTAAGFDITIERPAAGFARGPISLEYSLCASSGVVDPNGTIYGNTVSSMGSTSSAQVTQDRQIDINLAKNGSFVSDAVELGGRPEGSVIKWETVVSSDNLRTLASDIVIEDAFSANQMVCADGAITNLTAYQGRTLLDVTMSNVSASGFTMTIARPAAGFGTAPISLEYNLCSKSGIKDPNDTEYLNEVTIGNVTAEASVVQRSNTATGVAKSGRLLVDGPELGDEPAGTVVAWDVLVSSSNFRAITEDVVLTEEYSDTLTLCADPNVTNLRATQGATQIQVTMENITDGGFQIRLARPAAGFGNASIFVQYSLCASSGGVDENGTIYTNSVSTPDQTAEATVTQYLQTSGTAPDVKRGSFELSKSVNGVSPPADFQPTAHPFKIQVEEFAPGAYDRGEAAEVTYTLDVFADGSPVTGNFARPSGWTIRLTELVDENPAIGSHTWGPAAFFGTGVTSGTDAEGNPYALIVTRNSANPDEPRDNVAVSLTNLIQPPSPELGTTALVTGSPDNILAITGGEVVDTVAYSNIKADTDYVLNGEIMHVDADGNVTSTGVIASATFTSAGAQGDFVSGTAEVKFNISAAVAERYSGEQLVVFEKLFTVDNPDTPVATHEDPEDEDQTFWVERNPSIGTTALVTGSPDNVLALTGGEVVDTVAYTDLRSNTDYVLQGDIMHVDADGNVASTGVSATATFTTPAAPGEQYVSGTASVEFQISGDVAERYIGEKLVVFEKLFTAANPDSPVATHEDPEDEAQTFWVDRNPEIGTTALVSGSDDNTLALTGGDVIDTVDYTNLRANTDYVLNGEIMHVNAAGVVSSTGVLATAAFTTGNSTDGSKYVSGQTSVTFSISAEIAQLYAGEQLVVFEQLFTADNPDTPITTHEDPEDEDQTFDVEEPPTVIVVKEVSGPKGDDVEGDDTAVFQVEATWVDRDGAPQSRIFNVKPGSPVELSGLPMNTEITLAEVGATTGVSNIKWGDIIWSGEGVVDEGGDSTKGTVTITNPDAPVRVNLENKTSSNGLIIIPIPIPLPPGGGSSTPPTPTNPSTPGTPVEPDELPAEDFATPTKNAPAAKDAQATVNQPSKGLASTGANVAWLAGGAVMLLLLGAGLVLRGRRKNS